jgi:hypothetical protein
LEDKVFNFKVYIKIYILYYIDMTSEGSGEMFEGDSADTYAGKFPLMSMGAKHYEQRV